VAARAREPARGEAARRIRWVARLLAGEAAVMIGTESCGASNAKAKGELGWTLRYPSWRQGFAAVYAKPTASTATPIRTPASRSGSR
jgi:hypothetical protein